MYVCTCICYTIVCFMILKKQQEKIIIKKILLHSEVTLA